MSVFSAYKPIRASHVGINLWATPDQRQIVIVLLDDHGIFSRSGLKIGMKVDDINGVSCSAKSVNEVYRILEQAVGWVTINASAPDLPGQQCRNEPSITCPPKLVATDLSESSDDDDDDEMSKQTRWNDEDDNPASFWTPVLDSLSSIMFNQKSWG